MKRHHPFLSLLIALGFFLGQTGALVHATHHELVASPGQPACALCVFAHAASLHVAVPQVPAVAAPPPTHPAARIIDAGHFQRVHLPPSRAPPSTFV